MDPFKLVKLLTTASKAQINVTEPIKVIVPEGYRDPLSISAQGNARITIGKVVYDVKVRGMATKMPGWIFTGYQTAIFLPECLVSEIQYKQIIDKFIGDDALVREAYDKLIANYTFSNQIPKSRLFVRLSPSISSARRDYISNSIRSFFKDQSVILFDKKDALDAVHSSMVIFQIFVVIVGSIALLLAFFLLLISTTSNIRENVWEYGCLRAMGFTKSQGMRCFMYEQYSLILSSLVLGGLVGLVLAALVTAQFYLFLEFPFSLEFPTQLVGAMVGMALLTTFFAVYIPVKAVNRHKIAAIIKGLYG